MSLFDFLKAELRERGWSMTDLARRAGCSKQIVSQWLAEDPAERIIPGPKSCAKIAAALGVDPDYVLELAEHRQPRGEATAQVDAKRQAVRDQLERWLIAVGPDYEQEFWNYLKTHGDSGGATRHGR